MPSNKPPERNPIHDIVSDEFFDDVLAPLSDDDTHRVLDIPLGFIRPDPMQARRILPAEFHELYHFDHWPPPEIYKEMMYRVRKAFHVNSLSELAQDIASERIPALQSKHSLQRNPDDSSPGSIRSQKRALIVAHVLHNLYKFARAINQEGQIYPITVIDRWPEQKQRYIIDTGERRFWANWMLNCNRFSADFNEPSHTGTIPCLVIEDTPDNVFRQAQENMARESLSAVAIARQAAMLLWVAKGNSKPDVFDLAFYEQFIKADLTLRDVKEEVLKSMGDMNRSSFSRHLNLLYLAPEAAELAHDFNVSERQLRPLARLCRDTKFEISKQITPADQYELIVQIIEHGLSGAEVAAICDEIAADGNDAQSKEEDLGENDDPESIKITPWIDRTWRNITKQENLDIDEHAPAILKYVNGNVRMGRAWGESLIDFGQKIVKWMEEQQTDESI